MWRGPMPNEQRSRSAPSPTRPGLARVASYRAQVGQARLALGEGWGGGGAVKIRMAPPAKESHYPHPQPLPTRGRGAHRVRGKNVLQAQPNKLGTLRFGS